MDTPHEIHSLPTALVSQMRAGEVVERPLNVVKELVENALDAKARTVVVELLDGGKQLIAVSDDGFGIAQEQLKKALETHTTSKIKELEDLHSLTSFGFRGEALPSIVGVSHFTMKSRTAQQQLGKEIQAHGGHVHGEKSVPMAVGTTVQVKDLFLEVPARLKFLKSTATEFSQIHEFLTAMAFVWFGISFRLTHNGREVFHYTAQKTGLDRFIEIVGSQNAAQYVPLHFQRGSFKIQGFLGFPHTAKAHPCYFITSVNKRYVKDKLLRSALLQGYQGLVPKGLVAPALLFVQVDPSWVDVNAHPSKTEVRFYDPLALQDFVILAVQNALKKEIQQKSFQPTPVPPFARAQISFESPVFPRKTALLKLKNDTPLFTPQQQLPVQKKKAPPPAQTETPSQTGEPSQIAAEPPPPVNPTFEPLFESPKEYFLSKAQYLGQFARCYLLFQQQAELWFLDQHAFHERILFEEIVKSHTENKIVRQNLMAPIVVPCTHALTHIVFEQHARLNSLGFEIQALESGHIAIHAFPSFLSPQKIPLIFEDILARVLAFHVFVNPQTTFLHSDTHPLLTKARNISQTLFTAELQLPPTGLQSAQVFHVLFATMACHSAVRAGEPLDEPLVKRLLFRAENIDFYAHCPHGRPVIRKFTTKDVASWFHRI